LLGKALGIKPSSEKIALAMTLRSWLVSSNSVAVLIVEQSCWLKVAKAGPKSLRDL
jgi:hypothetical protein